jgi:hypothetical protein
MDIGDIAILIGIGIVGGAEADQESTDEGDQLLCWKSLNRSTSWY